MRPPEKETLSAKRGGGELKVESRMDRLRIYPNPILMRKAIPVRDIDGEVKDMADRMVKAMMTHQGIGLAAPQIGILRAMTVVDTGEGTRVFINPEVIEGEGESVFEEGCLSLPAVEIPVRRREAILLRAWDLNGKEMNLELTGLTSRVHQHEIDHLHGILIIHHISQLKRDLVIRKMFKDLKRSRGKGDALCGCVSAICLVSCVMPYKPIPWPQTMNTDRGKF